MKLRILTALLIALVLFTLGGGVAKADGIIIATPSDQNEPNPSMPGYIVGTPVPLPPIVPPGPFLSVKYHRVDVTINNQVAQTKVDQVFVNDSNREMEGTYIFPLPEDAAVSSFSMYVDGQKLEGKLLTKDEARQIYENTVRSRRDPALLEYVGRGAFQARIYPIPAHGERRIQIEYTQVLARENDIVRYVYPLSTEKFSPRPLQQVSINVTITGRGAINTVYSSSHDVVVHHLNDQTAQASYEASNVRPDKDFVLYYGLASGDVGASLLTYRQGNEDGYFLLLVAPRTQVDATKIAAKDVILVLDTSGSMQGQKLDQAKQALGFVLDRLNPNDRFALITFNTSVRLFDDGLVSMQRREAAHRFVDGISSGGSTNINEALLQALKIADPERPTVLIFLTDGLPTVGVTNTGLIVDNVRRAAPKSVRLFTFGVGYDVNTTLLDTLSANQRGASAYVKPGEDLEDAVSSFYAKVSQPVLTDISLDFGGARVSDLYPSPLPDLFAGSQLVLVGRYRPSNSRDIRLSGMVGDRVQQFTYSDVGFPAQTSGDTAFIARLWATRRIGYLLTEIRLHGTNKELVDEIVSLSTRYGIVTPYTSFLVDEGQNVLSSGGQQQAGEALSKSLAAPAPTAGAAAVQQSQTLSSLREAPSAAAAIPSAQVTTVGDKTFLYLDNVWTDTQYQEGMKTVDVGFNSADYFALLAARPEWGKYFAVGSRLIVVLDGTAYRVVAATPSTVTVPPTPTPLAPDTAPPPAIDPTPTPADAINVLMRVWQWILGLFGR